MSAPERKVVQLPDTDIYGVQEQTSAGTTVTSYSTDRPKPGVYDCDLGIDVEQLKEEITDAVGALAALMTRLRKLDLEALDGDEDAIAEAHGIMEERSYIDDDAIWRIEGDVETLEALVAERTEKREPIFVTVDEVDTKVKELVIPFLTPDDGRYVVTVLKDKGWDAPVTAQKVGITFNRSGRRVTVRIWPTIRSSWPPQLPEINDTEYQTALQELVAKKGEPAAKSIAYAVYNVVTPKGDVPKMIDLLRKAPTFGGGA